MSLTETLRRQLSLSLVLLATLVSTTLTSRAEAAGENLLSGRSPSRSEGVSNVKVLSDGTLAPEGEDWRTTSAAVISGERASVEYDLGQVTPIVAAYLQGDNNDEYLVSISEDGKSFSPLWTATSVGSPGLRERWSDSFSGRGRYVRLRVRGGDHAYSVSELQLFSERPKVMPPKPRRVSGESLAANVRSMLMYLVAAFAGFLFLTHRGLSIGRVLLLTLLPVAALGFVLQAISLAWPLDSRQVSFIRGVAGAIALLAVMRQVVPGKLWPARKSAVVGTLVTSALLAFAAFYNLGRAQFWDHENNQPEFVHTYDMRVYQPFARHFKELQYDGVYRASVLAYAEERHGGSLDAIAHTKLRSLDDHHVRKVADVGPKIQEVRDRFTDESWAELREDMRFFQETMGPEFLSTLTDHGANATPVWVFFARLFLAPYPASEGVLTIAGLVDALLLAGLAIAMWRSFGLLPMLVAMTIFGANDLYMFGTNWTGATLRHDWLVLLGFGACALKKEYWKLAGACLALSAMIRAFPGIVFVGVVLPALWQTYDSWRKERRFPHWRIILKECPETLQVLGAATACVLGTFLCTGLLYGFESWLNWWQKVTLLNSNVGLNEVSLRALIAGADSTAARLLQTRKLVYGLVVVICLAWIALLARKRPLHQSMLISLPLVWIVFNPSNYYSHSVFLLALLASTGTPSSTDLPETADAESKRIVPLVVPLHWIAAPLLVLCVAGYWAALDPDLERHFQDSTVLLFAAVAWLFANLVRRDPELRSRLLT